MEHWRCFIGAHWEKIKLQQLSREQFEQYIAWRRAGNGAFPGKNGNAGTPAKAKTVNTELDMLASMLNKAVEWRYLAHNPAKSVPRLKEDDRKAFRFFSIEEIELLRLVASLLDQQVSLRQIHRAVDQFYAEHAEMPPRESSGPEAARGKSSRDGAKTNLNKPVQGWLRNGRLLVDFLLTTGSREDEVLGLEWSWLDLKRETVSYRRRANWVPKSTERDISLKPEVIKRLDALPRVPGQAHVFLD